MTTSLVPLQSLGNIANIPYIDDLGLLPDQFHQKIGAYAIYSNDHTLKHMGYSRNILLSLKQHLIRQPHACHWIKAITIEKPSKASLENILTQWQAETKAVIYTTENQLKHWTQSIDIKARMTPEEQDLFKSLQGNEMGTIKHLKTVARRIESEISSQLEQKGFKDELRFNPKLKESGLLDLK